VIGSIIASIIVGIFFQPIITYISNIVTTTISGTYKGWNDGIYVQAAASPLFSSVYLIVTFITLFLLGFSAGATLVLIIMASRSRVFTGVRDRFIFSPRNLRRVTIMLLALTTPLALIVNSRIYSEFQATATFDQRLMALEPVISDVQRRTLRSEWAVMRSRADYDRINGQMEELAAKAHLVLPKPFI
jgi:hypothetical protein